MTGTAALDADSVGSPADVSGDPHPRIGERRVTDLSAVLGTAVWLVLLATATDWDSAVVEVELFVSLAVLVLVPIGLGVAATPRPATGIDHSRLYRLAVYGQFPGAVAAAAALTQPIGSVASVALVLPWLAVTGAIALVGFLRVVQRGVRPLPALAVDAALLYLPVGAVALLLHRADVSLPFSSFIVLLTVVHYHYAGFALPLVAGRVGRIVTDEDGRFGNGPLDRALATATVVIVVNLALIAVGITFSPTVEIVAVALFTLAVVVFSIGVLLAVVPTIDRLPAGLLALGSLTMLWTMALAMAYAYSAFPATGRVITITEMVTWHGRLNALAFALPGLIAFRLLDGDRGRSR